MHQWMPKEVHDAHIACLSEQGIVLPKDNSPLPEETLNKMKCLDQCVLLKLNVIDTDGAYHAHHVPQELEEASLKCIEAEGQKKLDTCEKVHSFSLCTFKASMLNLKTIFMNCVKETNTDLSTMISDWKHGDNAGHDHQSGGFDAALKNEKLACFHRCMMIKMHKIDENGELNLENLQKYSPDGVDMVKIVENCGTVNNEEEMCLKAVKRGLCVLEETREAIHHSMTA